MEWIWIIFIVHVRVHFEHAEKTVRFGNNVGTGMYLYTYVRRHAFAVRMLTADIQVHTLAWIKEKPERKIKQIRFSMATRVWTRWPTRPRENQRWQIKFSIDSSSIRYSFHLYSQFICFWNSETLFSPALVVNLCNRCMQFTWITKSLKCPMTLVEVVCRAKSIVATNWSICSIVSKISIHLRTELQYDSEQHTGVQHLVGWLQTDCLETVYAIFYF